MQQLFKWHLFYSVVPIYEYKSSHRAQEEQKEADCQKELH